MHEKNQVLAPFKFNFKLVSIGSLHANNSVDINNKKDKTALADTRRLNAEGRPPAPTCLRADTHEQGLWRAGRIKLIKY